MHLITKQDLDQFKEELLFEISALLKNRDPINKKWLRSSEVRKILNCSASTLQNMRIQGVFPYTKLGGIVYYRYDDIMEVLEKNKIDT